MKLNVTEENSPWTLDTPGGRGLGSKQNSLQGVSSALKLSDPPVGVVTDVGASPESTRSDANPYQRDNERGTETTHSHSKIDSPKGEALPEPSTHALPLTPEQNSPSAPLSIAPVVKSGQTKILCVSTISPDLPEFNFEEKAIQVTGADSPVALEELGISVVCKKGYKPNCSNNDGFFVSHVRGCTVCCVLDGHGPFGHEVCHVVQQDLLKLTTDNPDLPVKAKRVLREAFLKAHSNLQAKCNPFRLDSKLSGTTVTILVYLREQNKLFVAHVGNSRAVLCKFNKSDSGVHAVDLTVDHTPTNSKELRRIVKAEYKVDEKRDNFLLLCTDGVWNVISSQEAVEIAHSAKQKEWRTAPEELARESWRRWINEEQIFADDMTVLFLKLC
ncbi:protein phosphatase 2C, putative [Eimeria mitis]|uniref:Protein phosphatase 2C, putative n=1 Tax=Eimeria mitis TaxID=44415 RepID=U6K4T3_9EIME|nr:protein phosphatase 2C, putative [Eimeria mitis]CDJ30768.1 protein phosphatase 2C, putative [Eimeria mitis]